MKTKQYKQMQLSRMSDYYPRQAEMYKTGIWSFEHLKRRQKWSISIQIAMKQLDPTFGTLPKNMSI